MYKIQKVTFKSHPVLGNLSLDFCGSNGKAVNTIIIAGENGCGKTTILEELYKLMNYPYDFCDMNLVMENDKDILHIDCISPHTFSISKKNVKLSHELRQKLCAIYSSVDINFSSKPISSVTSMSLDENRGSQKSSDDLPKQIQQLFVDIQNLDDSSIARAVEANPKLSGEELNIDLRMPRFTKAFEQIFEDIKYNHIENHNGHKVIIFQKDGKDIPLDSLSSGEKQVVYRGSFLLKDANALKGAFVFIDEPEISLHPKWQQKILDYYKNIFTDQNGKQTSQIFIVTHSPFIIHNDNRRDDKVIVLCRENGNITVKDKPEYYKCNTVEAVEDAFFIHDFTKDNSFVYLEGRTDEKYFNKALEVFGYNKCPYSFKWVGYIDNNGREINGGKDSLNKAVKYMRAQNLTAKNICLYDFDANVKDDFKNNVYVTSIQKCDIKNEMDTGIENILNLDDIDLNDFYEDEKIIQGNGQYTIKHKLNKMKLCNYICSLDKSTLRVVLQNLKNEIDRLIKFYYD